MALGSLFAGRYEVQALIGEGGMGKVYTARDRELDKIIALKTIRSDGGGDPDAVARFKQELLLARKVSHRNVVRIFDLGESEGVKFFTMEFIEGQSLKALIRKRGRVPAAETVGICREVLAALQEAHAQGIIHRDLKPQNIMVDKSGMAHLMDFGIARQVDATGMTATGTTLGTPDYMSPEQVRGEKAGEPSDIFSFGVILYEMLTGDVPYHADSPISKIVMRLTVKPRAPHELTPDIPKYLEAVVQKCMEVDLALRYKNVAEILADLDRGQVDRSLTMRVQRAVYKSQRTIAAMVVAGVVVAGLVYWAVGRAAGRPAWPRCRRWSAPWPSCPSPTPRARPRWSGCGAACPTCWSPTCRSRSTCVRCRASGSSACSRNRASTSRRASTRRRSKRCPAWPTSSRCCPASSWNREASCASTSACARRDRA